MIRKIATENEWESVRRICCETARAGSPIPMERWPFFGENWIGPYQRLLPQWTWVAADGQGKILGYLTGCPNTPWLEHKRILRFDLPLSIRLARKQYPMNADARRYLKRLLRLEKSPERSFPANVHSRLRSLYPAHLHINLTSDARGSGLGRKLVQAYFEALQEERVCGVHVFCGDDPVPFYKRMGFETLHTQSYNGVPVHCMTVAL